MHSLLVAPEIVGVVVVRVVLVEVAKEVVEAFAVGDARCARLSQSPLADDARSVARAFENLRDGHVLLSQRYPLAAPPHVATDVCVPLMQPRHQAGARGGADGGGRVELCEAQPLARHAVEVRRPDELLAVAAEVAVAQVVGENQDDVRPALLPRTLRGFDGGRPRQRREDARRDDQR